MGIEVKTIGQLIDELITANLKIQHGLITGASERRTDLIEALHKYTDMAVLIDTIIKFTVVNTECWNAQETVMNSDNETEIAIAAKQAQKLNRARNHCIQEVDHFFGNSNTVLEKTY